MFPMVPKFWRCIFLTLTYMAFKHHICLLLTLVFFRSFWGSLDTDLFSAHTTSTTIFMWIMFSLAESDGAPFWRDGHLSRQLTRDYSIDKFCSKTTEVPTLQRRLFVSTAAQKRIYWPKRTCNNNNDTYIYWAVRSQTKPVVNKCQVTGDIRSTTRFVAVITLVSLLLLLLLLLPPR